MKEVQHDLQLFKISDLSNTAKIIKRVKEAFLDCDAYSWQLDSIIEETLFGKYSALLHNALLDDPKPYRKTVKDLVRHMFIWSIECGDDFLIKKYKHTTSISPTESNSSPRSRRATLNDYDRL